MNLSNVYTLLIPTYNRPDELARLLDYLVRRRAGFPILVLDSGTPENREENAAKIALQPLDIRHIVYDSSMPPFEKFWRGSLEAETEFCSICADDDVVLVDSLASIVEYLEKHPDYAVAHGWYFTFYYTDHVGVTSVVYTSRSIDQNEPLERLKTMFQRYEAVTYGLYRTSVMRQALGGIQRMRSLLAHELGAGAVTVLMGKAARVPLFYYGRSLGASQIYSEWHPIESLIKSPEVLFGQYRIYRDILLQHLQTGATTAEQQTDLLKLIDLIHLRYLSEYVKPEVMNWVIQQTMAGMPMADIMSGVWPRLTDEGGSPLQRMYRSLWLRRLRDRYLPNLRPHDLLRRLRAPADKLIDRTTGIGTPRRYRLYEGFLSGLGTGGLADDAILSALDDYV